jgi:hypothetical protein
MINTHNLVGKPGRKKPIGRSRRRWSVNIKVSVKEKGFEIVDWIHSVNMRIYFRVPYSYIINIS